MKRWLRELLIDIQDEHNVFVEFLLAWIAIMLSAMFILSILGLIKLSGG